VSDIARPLLETLGEFASELSLESAPAGVIYQAKLSILDTLGCIVAGSQVAEARRVAEVEVQQSAGLELSSIVGRERRTSVVAAACANAYAGDLFELNDLTGGHASIGVVPTALAAAEASRASGRELLEGVIAGIEVTSRVYAAYYPWMKPYEQTGITPPGIPSTLGAAAAAAKIRGLDGAQLASAMQIAGALAGWCPAEVIFGEGGTVKPMLFGAAPAIAADRAVAYASAGITGPARLLESRVGLYRTLAEQFDAGAIVDPQAWHLARPRRKRHACCGYIHSALDAVGALRADGVDVGAAAALEVALPPYILPVVSKSAPPGSANEARFHAQYCLALAVEGAGIITPEHSVGFERHLPRIDAVLRRIRITADDSLTHYHQSTVRGLDASGRELFARRVNAPRGAPSDPMSDDEVIGKFLALTRGSATEAELQAYVERINTLERAAECDWIARTFSTGKEH